MGTTSILNTFPHYRTNVLDKSIYTPLYREELPLHRPVFFGRAMQGPIGMPTWNGTYDSAKWMYGEGTFDKYSKYYSREAVYMQHLFERQGCFFVRLAPDTAKYSSSALNLKITPAQITQYKKDEFGGFVKDADGNKIPLTDATTGDVIKEPGYKLKWLKSTIAQDVTLNSLKPETKDVDGVTTQTFPILAHRALYPGEYGDELGYKIHYDPINVDAAQVARIGALQFQYYVVKKTYGQDTVSPVRSSYGDSYVRASIRPDAIDKTLDKNYALTYVLDELFWSSTMQLSKLPFAVHTYDNYYKAVATAILNVEPGVSETNPFMIDLFTGRKADGTYLDHVEIEIDATDPNNVVLNQNYIIYLSGGSDGDITDTAIEALTRQWLKDDIFPEISDSARFPITHIWDTGVLLDTKKAFLSFLAVRDDIKVILATQDCQRDRMNTKDEDMSVGMAVHSAALLQPESIIHGTECCRVEIYQQAGYLVDNTRYEGFLPLTLEAMTKRAYHQSKNYLDGMPKGLPLSQIKLFKVTKMNWFPCKVDHKQDSWDYGLNYVQFYDRHRVHWPDIRTVYRYDTSVLSSAIFTDAVVYTKHIVRYNWAVHAGKELPFEILASAAKRTTLKDMQHMLHGTYGVSVNFYRTEEEQKIGYITHGTVNLIGHAPNRIWDVDIVCWRSGYTPEEA